MATHIVTTSNWNDPAFWSGLSVSSSDTLDLSALGSSFTFLFHNTDDRMVISDGSTSFSIGGATNPNENVSLTGQGVSAFDTIIGPDGSMNVTHGSDANSLTGGAGDDTVQAGGGDDTITGGSGNDSLGAGSGNDSIDAGAGNDSVNGSHGNDTIDGGSGNDTIDGGLGNDTIDGGSGNDIIEGRSGDDNIAGEGGDDWLYGNLGSDTLSGGAGDDLLQGEHGDDLIDGGAGDDTINVSNVSDTDTIDGGESAGDRDELVFSGAAPVLVTFTDLESGSYAYLGGGFASGIFANIEHFDGGSGDDTLDFSAHGDAITVSYTDDFSGTISDGTDTITFKDIESLILTEQNDSVDASATHSGVWGDAPGVDIEGGGGDDTITGGRGGDTIDGGTGADEIDGGYGDDILSGGDGNDTIVGGDGNDSILGGEGADSIDGGDEGDTVEGGGGSDTINGGTGNDAIDGGNDADSFLVFDGFGNDTIIGGEGGTDDDTLDFSALTGPVTVTYTGNEAGTVTDGTDTLTFSEIEGLILTDQNDSVNAGANSVMDVDAGDGDDTIWSNLGNTSNDTIIGGGGNDDIQAGGGSDYIEGGTGNDYIDGGGGADTIFGQSGDDNLTGGTGNDVFNYSVGDGADTITDFNAGNTGTLGDGDSNNNDFINLSGFYDHLSELYADHADDGVLNQSNTTDARGYTVDYSDNAEFDASDSLTFQGASANNSSFTAENTGVACFTSGTAIRTPCGDVLIDDLRADDLVTTMDNGPQRILWIGKSTFGAKDIAENTKRLPIFIRRGVLDAQRDLLVSRQHCMLIDDTLVRAIHLTKVPGVRIAHGKREVIYYHILFERHQIVFAESAPSESFYPGTFGIAGMAPAARNELELLLPGISKVTSRVPTEDIYGSRARSIIKPSALVDELI